MITFKQEADEVTTTITTELHTWMDVAESFFDFLRGCGYQLDRNDLSTYFYEAPTEE